MQEEKEGEKFNLQNLQAFWKEDLPEQNSHIIHVRTILPETPLMYVCVCVCVWVYYVVILFFISKIPPSLPGGVDLKCV